MRLQQFRVKKINDLTLGDYLKKRRSRLRYTIQKVGEKTGINTEYIHALEEMKYKELPPEVYVKGIIKKYSEFLKLNSEFCIKLYEDKKIIPRKTYFFKNPLNFYTHLGRFINYKTFILIITSVVVSAVLYYLLSVIFPLYTKPPFSLENPPKCPYETNESKISIKGLTQPEVIMWSQDEKVFVDKDGRFEFDVFLKPGENQLQFKIVNKFQKERTDYCLVKYIN